MTYNHIPMNLVASKPKHLQLDPCELYGVSA